MASSSSRWLRAAPAVVAATITDIPGASDVFGCGVCAPMKSSKAAECLGETWPFTGCIRRDGPRDGRGAALSGGYRHLMMASQARAAARKLGWSGSALIARLSGNRKTAFVHPDWHKAERGISATYGDIVRADIPQSCPAVVTQVHTKQNGLHPVKGVKLRDLYGYCLCRISAKTAPAGSSAPQLTHVFIRLSRCGPQQRGRCDRLSRQRALRLARGCIRLCRWCTLRLCCKQGRTGEHTALGHWTYRTSGRIVRPRASHSHSVCSARWLWPPLLARLHKPLCLDKVIVQIAPKTRSRTADRRKGIFWRAAQPRPQESKPQTRIRSRWSSDRAIRLAASAHMSTVPSVTNAS